MSIVTEEKMKFTSLELVKTLMIDDELTTPLLQNFSVLVKQIFA